MAELYWILLGFSIDVLSTGILSQDQYPGSHVVVNHHDSLVYDRTFLSLCLLLPSHFGGNCILEIFLNI